MNEWISTSERLPEKSDIKWRSTMVLGVIGQIGRHVRELEYKEHDTDGKWYFFRGKWSYTTEEVTHWMPMPEPPSE